MKSAIRGRGLRSSVVGVFAGLLLVIGCAPSAPVASPVTPAPVASPVTPMGKVDRNDRRSVMTAYRDGLAPLLGVTNGWSGNVSTCDPGSVTPAHQRATLDTINWFRDFVGLEPVTFDPVYSAKAQKAALMMDANNKLSHEPEATWSCYTADGAEAAGRSNISLGRSNGPRTVADGYVADPGANNTAVGHRRWILDPTRRTMGSGTTARANALWVLGGTRPMPSIRPVVAWPSDGYFPVQLEPNGRWSLSIPGANFNGAGVQVTDDRGVPYGVTIHPVANGYGQNTLVWQVNGLDTSPTVGDRTYTVKVSGITAWTSGTLTYSVTLFDAS